MTRTLTVTAAIMAVLTAGAADAQTLKYLYGKGVYDETEWREPTIEDAVTLLLGGQREKSPIVAILRQEDGPRPEAELDALAERLADSIIADTTKEGRIRSAATSALWSAARHDDEMPGTAHRGSFDAMVRAYETVEAQGLLGPYNGGVTLSSLYLADEDRGRAYAQNVFDMSEPQPDCQRGGYLVDPDDPRPECTVNQRSAVWCRAGGVLYRDEVYTKAERQYNGRIVDGGPHAEGPLPVKGLSEPAERWWNLCWDELVTW